MFALLPSFFLSFFLLLTSSFPVFGQRPIADQDPVFGETIRKDCPEKEDYPFTGDPEMTLCEENPDFECRIEIGEGTAHPRSSMLAEASLSGNICITGNFIIDGPISFVDAVVKINAGVSLDIGVATSLTINNSKLFACDDLWAGIKVGFGSTIFTSNLSIIEDAEIAISASGFSVLNIQSTYFNRNRIGIELEGNNSGLFTHQPMVQVFKQNRFFCDAPLNGTVDEITSAGIKLNNASLYGFQSNSGLNRFYDLIDGIRGEGITNIGVKNFWMDRIKGTCVFLEEGILKLTDCRFNALGNRGVDIGTASLMNIENTSFIVLDEFRPDFPVQEGIYIRNFGINADVKIKDITFNANLSEPDRSVYGIFIWSPDAGANIRIRESTFKIQANYSTGIYITGNSAQTSTTKIWLNKFFISGANLEEGAPIPFPSTGPKGVYVYGAGNVNNLSIKWNSFTAAPFTSLSPFPQNGVGIVLEGNELGTNNEVSINSFNDNVESLLRGVGVVNFQHTKYCSNTFTGSGLFGVGFAGLCGGTDFTGNIFRMPNGRNLRILNAIITPQFHKGNEWYPMFSLNPGNLNVNCSDNYVLNKFTVHTPKSTCDNTNDPSCFNTFHPRRISPPDENGTELFDIDPIGTPEPGCTFELAGRGTDELDEVIAQGQFTPTDGDLTAEWQLQRYVYRKLMNNPDLIEEHPSFSSFMNSQSNNSVGQFDEVHESIKEALKAEEDIDIQSTQTLADIATLIDAIADIDELMAQQGATEALMQEKEDLIVRIQESYQTYSDLKALYKSQMIANLQDAYGKNQAISVSYDYELSEKVVNKIYLVSLMQQDGELTEDQIEFLTTIAQQSRKEGGSAVYAALGLLPDCLRLSDEIKPFKQNNGIGFEEETWFTEDEKNVTLSSSQISFYPNPASTSIMVRNPEGNTGILQLTDMTGKVWLEHLMPANKTEINVEAIPQGVYLLKLFTDNGHSFVEKLIIH